MAHQEHIAILQKGIEQWNEWRSQYPEIQIDLNGANLSSVHPGSINISKDDKSHPEFSTRNLCKINLSGACLDNADLCHADLRDADLRGSSLKNANLSNADLRSANLSRSDLQGTYLNDARLHGAILDNANLQGARLHGVDLSNASLVQANLSSVDMSTIVISGGIGPTYLRRVNLTDADLSMARMDGANLSMSRLSGAILSKTSLNGANMQQTYLSNAILSYASLNNVNMNNADLSSADLSYAELSHSDLNGASLRGSNLSNANLSDVNLSDVNLSNANLSNASLSRTNLAGAVFFQTVVAYTDLRTTKGLLEIWHSGPSILHLSTVQLPQDESALRFLQETGTPDIYIDLWRTLMMHPIQYYSLFISYSLRDELLARLLYTDLQAHGVRCWFAPEDLKIGDKFRARIDEAIHRQEKLLLLLSGDALESGWVEDEVEAALEKEKRQQREVLFPIRLDEEVMITNKPWAAKLRRQRHIGDFTRWREPEKYFVAFERLLRDLKKVPIQ